MSKKVRIGYGPPSDPYSLFWVIMSHPAKQDVTITGSALRSIPVAGSTFACVLSDFAMAAKEAFPHPVLMAHVTHATLTVITRIANGAPVEGVRYTHNYSDLVGLND